MAKTFLIDGQSVTISWGYRQHPRVYMIWVGDVPLAGALEKTALGRYLAVDDQRRRLGTYLRLQEAVGRVVLADQRTPEVNRDAVRDVLSDPRYREHARQLQDQLRELPEPEHAVSLLEERAVDAERKGTSA